VIENKVILVGNGINNIQNTYKWKNLILDLIDYVGAKGQININKKPFPLLYEEIYLKEAKKNGLREDQIKSFIAEKTNQIQPNEIHKEISNVKFRNILTTNYDYNLERAQGLKKGDLENIGVVKESKYSLFRCINNFGNKIWHIHGECNFPRTITLGYEHYSGYLQHMRNYVVTGTGDSYNRKFKSLRKRLKSGIVKLESWIDYFFKKNIFIIGLRLDFVEIHLWWLLTYSARIKFTKQIPIKNKIFYFYPANLSNKNKLDFLKSNDVILRPINMKPDNTEYYFRIFDRILRR